MRRFAVALLAVSMFGVPAVALAGPPVVQISAMLGTREKRGLDPRLHDFKADLRGLPFKGFRLLGVHSCRLQSGDQCGMELPGNSYLYLSTSQSTDRFMKMHLLLNRDNRPMFNADLTLNHGAVVIIRGPRFGEGAIVIGLRAVGSPAEDSGSPGRRAR
ncbi:MAG: hypothetical protein D6815_02920 [Candidatus Dadabacteria bacterium]|nr:MAG: hypothetical protein D6815_02920 [Candidatus Dadabacteria bacterium]